ncbi:MAG: polyamine aminopropyltransferase [Pseudomonadota bacterium]
MTTSKWFEEANEKTGIKFGLALEAKLHEEQSPYQKLEIYQTKTFGNLMVIDDCIMLTQRDNFLYHEMISHPALLSHPHPKKVLIIGGGDCGTLREVLKHPSVTEAVQCDIDERVTRLAEKYFPELCESNNDPRAQLVFKDGVEWVQNQADESIDVVIIDSTDPVGFAEALFGPEFLSECYRILSPTGVLVQQSESPFLHADSWMGDLLNVLKDVGFDTIQPLSFPQPVYPSGWWSVTLAGKGLDVRLFRDTDSEDISETTQYYNAEIHQAALAIPQFLKSKVKTVAQDY